MSWTKLTRDNRPDEHVEVIAFNELYHSRPFYAKFINGEWYDVEFDQETIPTPIEAPTHWMEAIELPKD